MVEAHRCSLFCISEIALIAKLCCQRHLPSLCKMGCPHTQCSVNARMRRQQQASSRLIRLSWNARHSASASQLRGSKPDREHLDQWPQRASSTHESRASVDEFVGCEHMPALQMGQQGAHATFLQHVLFNRSCWQRSCNLDILCAQSGKNATCSAVCIYVLGRQDLRQSRALLRSQRV